MTKNKSLFSGVGDGNRVKSIRLRGSQCARKRRGKQNKTKKSCECHTGAGKHYHSEAFGVAQLHGTQAQPALRGQCTGVGMWEQRGPGHGALCHAGVYRLTAHCLQPLLHHPHSAQRAYSAPASSWPCPQHSCLPCAQALSCLILARHPADQIHTAHPRVRHRAVTAELNPSN